MKISFGDVLLARFPYTDLTSDKRRPVLVVSADNEGPDLIVCAITSRPQVGARDVMVDADPEIGLKTRSWVQFDKIATVARTVVAGKLGVMPAGFMARNEPVFLGVFGFG